MMEWEVIDVAATYLAAAAPNLLSVTSATTSRRAFIHRPLDSFAPSSNPAVVQAQFPDEYRCTRESTGPP